MPPRPRYSDSDVTEAVRLSTSIAQVMRVLGIRPAGGSHAHISRLIKRLDFDTSHFMGQASNRGLPARNRLGPENILIVHPEGSPRVKPHLLRRALAEVGTPSSCVLCATGCEWNGGRLQLPVDHINGNYLDCRMVNLRFLCPNCHSQTPNFAGRVRGGQANGSTEPVLGDSVGHI
ncbi:MAG: HNH endonuclease [Actinomycetia bacterium]|nr:HNH endonuclease [Actinomycetes bacterium]